MADALCGAPITESSASKPNSALAGLVSGRTYTMPRVFLNGALMKLA